MGFCNHRARFLHASWFGSWWLAGALVPTGSCSAPTGQRVAYDRKLGVLDRCMYGKDICGLAVVDPAEHCEYQIGFWRSGNNRRSGC